MSESSPCWRGDFLAVCGAERAAFADGRPGRNSGGGLVVFYGGACDDPRGLDAEPLVRALFPRWTDFAFSTACAALGVSCPAPALALGQLFLRILDEAATLDRDVLALIAHLLGGTAGAVLLEVAAAPRREPGLRESGSVECGQGERPGDGLVRSSDPWEPLARSHPRFEDRPGQRYMERKVAECLAGGGALLVEAGPGTGKTYAYLLPALAHLEANPDDRVVICTRTKQLQEQIFFKDLPFLLLHTGSKARTAVLKGRENYLCLRKWELAVREITDTPALRGLASLAPLGRWLFDTEAGDIDENTGFLSQAGAEEMWPRLSDSAATCTGSACVHAEECFSIQARRRARQAGLVVVNHSLLAADASAGRSILGRVDRLIVDEAHALEGAARSAFSETLSMRRVERLVEALAPAQGSRRPSWLDRLPVRGETEGRERVTRAAVDAETQARRLFRKASAELPEARRGSLAGGALWTRELDPLRSTLRRWELDMERTLEDLGDEPELAREGELGLDGIRQIGAVAEALVRGQVEGEVHWYERDGGSVDLHVTPLSVATKLASMVYEGLGSLILTSATLSSVGGFRYVREALGVDAAFSSVEEVQVASTFAYGKRMRILAPTDFPSVRDEAGAYAERLAELLVGLTRALARNTLVLFTSFELLFDVRERVHRLVPTLAQGIDGPRGALVEQFRRGGASLLLGTDSFWEGVDFPGEELEVLVVTRLPFPVPSDPVFAALCDDAERKGRDAFLDLSMPLAVLRLRQGIGRLIRTSDDQGVVVITDERILHRSYGNRFREALPTSIDAVRGTDGVVRAAVEWFEGTSTGTASSD
ncbi:MAG: ATP-dependent DNA helicase [Candidatus Bipolaricaulota bacterium]